MSRFEDLDQQYNAVGRALLFFLVPLAVVVLLCKLLLKKGKENEKACGNAHKNTKRWI